MKPTLSLLLTAVLTTSLAVSSAGAQPSKAPMKKPAAGATSNIVPLKDPVAIVDGVKISKTELEKAFKDAIAASGMPAGALTAQQKLQGYHQILDGIIMEKIIDQKSAGTQVPESEVNTEIEKIKKQFPSPEVFNAELKKSGQTMEQFTANLKKSIRETNWMKAQIQGKDEVTEADVKKFYDDNMKQFANPDMVKATHILFIVPQGASPDVIKAKEAAAKAAIARANKGEDFSKLAKELSEEPGAKQRGGDLGFFSKEQMVPEFSTAAFSQKVGSVSQAPVKTKFGYHVIKVTDKKAAGTMPFADVKQNIMTYLQNQKRREAFKAIMQQQLKDAKVENFLPPVPVTPPASAAGNAKMLPVPAPATK